jgi:hypothetical protein
VKVNEDHCRDCHHWSERVNPNEDPREPENISGYCPLKDYCTEEFDTCDEFKRTQP